MELADIWSQKTTLERLDLVEHAAHLVIAAGPRRALTNTWEEFTSSLQTSVVPYKLTDAHVQTTAPENRWFRYFRWGESSNDFFLMSRWYCGIPLSENTLADEFYFDELNPLESWIRKGKISQSGISSWNAGEKKTQKPTF